MLQCAMVDSCKYKDQASMLMVTVIRAKKLKNMDTAIVGYSDPYVKVICCILRSDLLHS